MEQLLASLTLEEKVALCAGKSMWISTPVPRLGIPALKLSDGPNAARGDVMGGVPSACFPVGVALAATWNAGLIEQVGQALGQEAHTKDVQVLLGPTINLHRHPLGGRNFECYSEDPYLSGAIAVAFIRGVQSEHVAACAKHFVCNDSEFERHSISSQVDERTLRELYLRPFEMAVRQAGVWTVMSAYNRVNGVFASSHQELMRGVLKGEWGFDGFVVSDWGAALETVGNALGGLDLEMPGPTRTRGRALVDAVRAGTVDEALIDDSVRRLLRITQRTGKFEHPDPVAERAESRPEHEALARRAAAEAMVLVKNQGVLPFDPTEIRHLAVIGPNAARGQIQGGGSSAVVPHYQINPLGALEQAFDKVTYAVGCSIDKYVPAPDRDQLAPDESFAETGLALAVYDSPELSGQPVVDARISLAATPWGFTPLAVPGSGASVFDSRKTAFSAAMSGCLRTPVSGVHTFGLLSAGLTRLYVNDVLLIDNWSEQQPGDALFGFGSAEKRAQLELREGATYHLKIEFQSLPGKMLSGLRFGLLAPQSNATVDEAVRVAAAADAVVLIAGSNADWETEGNDRASLALPGQQDELIRRVLAANPRCAVVLNTGAAVAMPWFDQATCLVQAWLPGQEFGHALVDIVTGAVNPSGRMPTTFPVHLEDTPAFADYPGANGVVRYGEGLLMGYRWYDTRNVTPLVPFGHGLSYTSFEYSDLAVVARDGGCQLSLMVSNTGERAGQEVVQVYLHRPGAEAGRPEQELCAFAKVELEPGGARRVDIAVGADAFRHWHVGLAEWCVPRGPIELRVGASSRDIRLTASIAD